MYYNNYNFKQVCVKISWYFIGIKLMCSIIQVHAEVWSGASKLQCTIDGLLRIASACSNVTVLNFNTYVM